MPAKQSMAERPWLITGATGLLGQELVRQAAGRVPLCGTFFSRQPDPHPAVAWAPLDVGDESAVHALIHALQPAAIIHTAYRKTDPGLWRVTALGAGYVAQAAAQAGARLVHVSSDVLLDGEHAPYDESAQPGPLQPYGFAKAEAERLVAQAAPEAVLVRTSLICRLDPPDPISAWIIDSVQQGQPITLFTDEIRSPVWVQDLAAALLELATLPFAGILNVAGPQPLSRYAMGMRLARHLGLDARGLSAGSSLASGLQRPRNCTLEVSLARRLLRTRLRGYDEGLESL